MVERVFETSRGPLKIKLFEDGAGWSLNDGTPHILAWSISQMEFRKLPELERIKVKEEYFQWLVGEGCGKCKLLGNVCSGLKPYGFNRPVDGQSVVVNDYEADFNEKFSKWRTLESIEKVIKEEANCKPKFR